MRLYSTGGSKVGWKMIRIRRIDEGGEICGASLHRQQSFDATLTSENVEQSGIPLGPVTFPRSGIFLDSGS